MKKIIMAAIMSVGLVGASLLGGATAQAAPSCANCDATTVAVNGDGTVTASTTAVPNGGCIGAVSPTKYSCVVKVFSASNLGAFETTGGPTTVNLSQFTCPCTAQFWVHAGQWHAYSAMSAPFTP